MTMGNHAAATLAARRRILGVQRLGLVPAEASFSSISSPKAWCLPTCAVLGRLSASRRLCPSFFDEAPAVRFL